MRSRCRRSTGRSRSAATSSTRRGSTATGSSEQLLGETLRAHRGATAYVATKIPPKNRSGRRKADYPLDEVFPPDHIREYTEKSLGNLGVDRSIFSSFTSGATRGPNDDGWQRAVDALKGEELVRAIGISVNRWEPANVLRR